MNLRQALSKTGVLKGADAAILPPPKPHGRIEDTTISGNAR